jgi:hypothetical protein
MPDKQAEKTIGTLLPVINLDAFGEGKTIVREWLQRTPRLRTRIDQLTESEWKDILVTRICDKAPIEQLVSDERLRYKITRWYEACLETVAEHERVSQNAFALCPLLCRKANTWQYVAGEPRYLSDDNDFADAFTEDVWLFDISAQFFPNALKYLGVCRLSKSIKVHVTPGEPTSLLPDELLRRLNESLPFVWAWRSSQSKQDAETLADRLKKLTVHVVPGLKANLSLNGVRREVERRSHVMGAAIYLHEDHANESELAQALSVVIDVRSEADFYEVLLESGDDRRRKEKLRSKGMVDADVERRLREYSEWPVEDEPLPGDDATRPTKEDASGRSQPRSACASQPHQPKSSKNSRPNPEPKAPSGASLTREPLHLKDATVADYVLGTSQKLRAESIGGGGGGGSGGGGTGHEGGSLSDCEKAELEEAGRLFAARELESLGFSVEKMPLDNPGFDLRATRKGEELRVEVKAHSQRATIVNVTQRQYKEYLGQQGYWWELWNVEHLAENETDLVTITRYDDIPEDALDARMFRVDLKKCQSPAKPSSPEELNPSG